MELFSENIFSKIFFPPVIKVVYLFTLELKHGQGECLFVSLSVFGQHNFVWAGAWGWEHGGRSLVMGAIFFSGSIFKTFFSCYDSKPLNCSHWHGSVGQ